MNITNTLNIAVLPGDGIGREVMTACLDLLREAEKHSEGPTLGFENHSAGAQFFLESGDALPASVLESCRKADAVLFGAMGWPGVRNADGTEIIPQLDLRMALDLYAGVRPIRWFPGLPQVLSDERAKNIDFVLVREQTEGLFYARGRGKVIDDSEAYDTMQITRKGTERVCKFAFDLAARRSPKSHVTCVDKANVFTSMAFFRKVFQDVAAKHTNPAEYAYVDAMALTMIKKPWTLDVLVTENMFGDILSDLAAGLIGGMGMAPSADLGDHHGLFQPAHGTAPDIAGQGKANPSAMILSSAMMLDWLASRHNLPALGERARIIENALEDALSQVIPMEFGGSAGTAELTRVTKEALPRAARRVRNGHD